MATIQLSPPEPFNFRKPDEWPRWHKRFDQFRVASGLSDKSAAKQVNTLLYCLGEEAEAILNSTNISTEERSDYNTVVGKLDSFFKVRRNVIFERARFNRRNQLPGESSEQYIVALYNLAANCEYGGMEGEMIRDRLVVGIRDTALSERLQLDPDLTLEKAKKSIRQREAVHEQQGILSEATAPSVEALHAMGNRTDRRRYQQQRQASYGKGKQRKHCTRCGKEPHSRDKCPAKDATCNKCRKKGHYAAQCLTKNVSALSPEKSSLDTAFLDETSSQKQEAAWLADIKVGKNILTFKLDTGAEVTAISREAYRKLPNAPPLSTPEKILCGPSRKHLPVVGQ